MSGNRTPNRKLSASEGSLTKPVISPAARNAIIDHILRPPSPPYDPNPLPPAAKQGGDSTAKPQTTPRTPQQNVHGNAQDSDLVSDTTPTAQTPAPTIQRNQPADRSSKTPERDAPTLGNVFEVSPGEFAPGQNAFGTPDRPHSPDEQAPNTNHGHVGAAITLARPAFASLESSAEHDEDLATDIGVEKRNASRSPEGKKDAKKAKGGDE